jgi:hypothetical protein
MVAMAAASAAVEDSTAADAASPSPCAGAGPPNGFCLWLELPTPALPDPLGYPILDCRFE